MAQKNKIAIFISALVIAAIVCTFSIVKFTKKNRVDKQSQVWLTVFVHGSVTAMLRPPSLNTLFGVLKDRIEGTLYKNVTEIMRNDTFCAIGQPMLQLGLQKIDKSCCKPDKSATALANIIDKQDFWLHKRTPDKNYYYTYGWPGLVSKKVRYRWAKRFYKELSDEFKKFQAQGINPKLRIFAYSHGGNVSLNLGKVQKNEKPAYNFSVDELILMGVPLHHGNDYLVNSPIFKKVYNFFSPSDVIQKLDFCARGSLFSRKTFESRKKFQIPDKLTQVKLKMARNRKTKKTWPKSKDPRRHFDRPDILYGNSRLLRRSSPGHIELWFFNWAGKDYRQSLPLNPLPVVALMPAILYAIEKNRSEDCKRYTVDLRPEQTALIVKGNNKKHAVQIFSEDKFTQLQNIGKKYAIPLVTDKDRRRAKNRALKKARSRS